jgi:ubiquinone/menaquinone biosynthesis C-methylase UbiE
MNKKTDPSAEGENFLKWDFFNNPNVCSDIVSPIVKLISNAPFYRVLELGAGTGILIEDVKKQTDACNLSMPPDLQRKIEYHAVDILPPLARAGNEKHNGIEWHCADNKNLPFPDKYFNIVFMRGALHYEESAEAQRQVIREASRVLATSGYFINWQYCFHTLAEAQLLNSFYRVLPKIIRAQTISEFRAMHAGIFWNAKFLPNPNSHEVRFDTELFRTRYNFNAAQQKQICDIIATIHAEKRPNFWTDGTDFRFVVPQRIIQCRQQYA